MPLLNGNHPHIIAENIRELKNAGHAEKQAIAIAYAHAKVSSKLPKFKAPVVAALPAVATLPAMPKV